MRCAKTLRVAAGIRAAGCVGVNLPGEGFCGAGAAVQVFQNGGLARGRCSISQFSRAFGRIGDRRAVAGMEHPPVAVAFAAARQEAMKSSDRHQAATPARTGPSHHQIAGQNRHPSKAQ